MARLTTKKIKNEEYLYLEKPVRICGTVRNISYYLGKKEKIDKKDIHEAEKKFDQEIMDREADLRTACWDKTAKYAFPFNSQEIKKIETMNLKYKQIIRQLHPQNRQDMDKRFIANYVFESNALEGNSLTLKNVAEIVFENRISTGKDLREIYDAQNSYNLFLYLKKARQEINHNFLIQIHSRLIKNIDDRTGYRIVPVFLVGREIQLPEPEEVPKRMEELFRWFRKNEKRMHPLELAFKFHALFEQIHPFCDGNGRMGRFLLNYILMRKGYFPVIIRKTSRQAYISSLEAADHGHWDKLMRFALEKYKDTFRNFFEIYYRHSR